MNVAPKKLIIGGGILAVLGVLGPLLMVLEIVPASFALSFLSYTASIAGVLLGMIGSAYYVRGRGQGQDLDR
ncbi:MAG TPA: hypothetical protein ENN99_12510 [Chloroflexi bacterium]|nr:hypothetical protein [Chloroflexota bacterium]